MKEAAGEANMTVITIVLIAIVLGVGTIIVTNLLKTTSAKSECNNMGGTLSGDKCTVKLPGGGTQVYTCETNSSTGETTCQ